MSNTSTGAIVRDSYYFYDAGGTISSARIYVYNGNEATEYNLMFRTNIQGDVCEILNSDGTSIMSIVAQCVVCDKSDLEKLRCASIMTSAYAKYAIALRAAY